jgi:hypothetical protein
VWVLARPYRTAGMERTRSKRAFVKCEIAARSDKALAYNPLRTVAK